MRDLLTAAALALVVALVAALAIPPLINWPAHRKGVDKAIARAIGAPVRTEGQLEIRLLPSPRLRVGRLRIGTEAPDSVLLDAAYVKAEIALVPLLSGEVRLLDTRIGRAEIKLPTGAGGDWRVPRALADAALSRRRWVFDDLAIQQFLVTTSDPRTGRTDQGYAENVLVRAGSLAGPWRIAGLAQTVPFEVALGELGDDYAAGLKAGAGGGERPRVDAEGRLVLLPEADGTLVPRLTGSLRFATKLPPPTPSGSPVPVSARASIEATGPSVALSDLTAEIGEGTGAVRATGSGRYELDQGRLALTLASRRIDLPALARLGARPAAGQPGAGQPAAGQPAAGPSAAPDLAGLLARWQPPRDLPLDLSVSLDALALGGDEDLTQVRLAASLADDRVRIAHLSATGPGRATLAGSGEITLPPALGASGRIEVAAQESERFGRFMGSLGLDGATSLLTSLQPLEASADIALAGDVVSLRNLRVAQGDARLAGTVRLSGRDGAARPRLDAQLAVQHLGLFDLVPSGEAVIEAARDLDLGLTLDVRDIAHGGERGGRISGRIATDGPEIRIEGLEVRDLAGAEADLSGRLAPDGSGRIEGRLAAARAAPLLDLVGPVWLGGLARLIPEPVRQSPLDLKLTSERVAPDLALRTSIAGRLGSAPVEATTVSGRGGGLGELSLRLSAADGSAWLPALPDRAALPPRPARISLAGRRDGEAGPLVLDLQAELAGVTLTTSRPLQLGSDQIPAGGEADLVAEDASGLAAALGIAGGAGGPLPVKLKVVLAGAGRLGADLAGTVGAEPVSARLALADTGTLQGRVELARLSLPWLASALALNAPTVPPGATPIWPTARFGPGRELPVPLGLDVKAARLELGQGLVVTDASLALATRNEGFEVRDLSGSLAGGRLGASFSLERQGGLAALIGEARLDSMALDSLLGGPFAGGRLSGILSFGASGESPAGLVAALGGAGEVAIEALKVEASDPAAPSRVAARALKSEDPLAAGRWQAFVPEELGRGPLAAGRVAGAGSLVAGALRFGPLAAEAEGGTWRGTATIDLKTLAFDARGTLWARSGPPGWSGAPPAIGLGWSGPLGRLARTVDPAPLLNGLATAVLGRELDRVDTFDLDEAERRRRNGRTEYERQRRLDQEAARQAKLREEAIERARRADRERLERDGGAQTGPPPPPARPSPEAGAGDGRAGNL